MDHLDLVERTELLFQELLERKELLDLQEGLDLPESREKLLTTMEVQDLLDLPVKMVFLDLLVIQELPEELVFQEPRELMVSELTEFQELQELREKLVHQEQMDFQELREIWDSLDVQEILELELEEPLERLV